MTDPLHVWADRTHAGLLYATTPNRLRFTYDPTYTGRALSLAMPVSDTPVVADRWVKSLLPENPDFRAALAAEHHVPDAPFPLLAAIGADALGSVSFTVNDDPTWPDDDTPQQLTDDDLADHLARLSKGSWAAGWRPGHRRFSITGWQPKLALTRIGTHWFWSTWATPSNTILKPAITRHRHLNELEAATLTFATSIGIRASHADVVHVHNQTAFATTRWDRAGTVRLPAEDLTMAMGIDPDDKYNADLGNVLGWLSRLDPALIDPFLDQVGFNLAVGNGDAHLRNYSLVTLADGLAIAPLYDSFPLFLLSDYTADLPVRIGKARRLADLSPRAIRTVADTAHLDPDRITTRWQNVFEQVLGGGTGWVADAGLPPNRVREWAKHLTVLARAQAALP